VAKTPKTPPSDFELQILGVLWEGGPATVRQVLERLGDGKDRAYTSVLSVMQVMQKKGLLAAEKGADGPAHVFRPLVARDRVAGPLLRGLVAKVFGGRTHAAVQQLLDDGRVSRDEIEQLRDLLDRVEARQQKKKA
jgi:BlaI family transcriptional regulator, penicillinase repressor